jgi:hypothetical protein
MPPVAVKGLGDVVRGLKTVERDVRLGVRKELRGGAEPVRATAQELAVEGITNIGPVWPRMRVGVTQKAVYVAPRARSRGRRSGRRPNLAGLLMERAMEPALERHQDEVVRKIERALDRACSRFNRGF